MTDRIPAKSILSGARDGSDWFGGNYNMNLYKGCCHGCIYCDSRSDCYHIEQFDHVRVKENALALLAKELSAKQQSGVIETGAMNDPYNPFEAEERITRGALELIDRYLFGVSITTKSSLVARDIDCLSRIHSHSPVIVKMTVTTADDHLSRLVEPRVCPSKERLQALSEISKAGIYAGVLFTPVLPFIEDTEENVRNVVRKAADSGAQFVYASFGVTLRMNQRDYFYDRLEESFPGVKRKYIEAFGDRYYCQSLHARRLESVFRQECGRAGMVYRMADIIAGYQSAYQSEQLSLF